MEAVQIACMVFDVFFKKKIKFDVKKKQISCVWFLLSLISLLKLSLLFQVRSYSLRMVGEGIYIYYLCRKLSSFMILTHLHFTAFGKPLLCMEVIEFYVHVLVSTLHSMFNTRCICYVYDVVLMC
jgi:hypothetical protein